MTDTNISDPTKIKQALDGSEAATKVFGLLAVANVGLCIWKRNAFQVGITIAWVALCVFLVLVSRARRKKLKALDSG